ncbi:MAG: hypothetical protein NC122_03965 [Faecalibacterium sp.]|nr:hypothetical protein [Ruminococcus sp.]MCM1391745.1 hypothetical protein [Ruminococcus sp.]MCM1485342.1 hypothetical protein [Faecalibacterium sp.]
MKDKSKLYQRLLIAIAIIFDITFTVFSISYMLQDFEITKFPITVNIIRACQFICTVSVICAIVFAKASFTNEKATKRKLYSKSRHKEE